MEPRDARQAADPEVVVVGLGPTGLVLSLVLARLGVRVACVEKAREPVHEPRAASIDDVAQRIMVRECPPVANLVEALRTQLVSHSGQLLFDLPPHLSQAGHSDIGFFFQPHLEEALRAKLRELDNATLHLGWEVVDVEDIGSQCVTSMRLVGPALDTMRLSSAFVVGCDGGSSRVREFAGLELQGTTYEEDGSWLVVDLKMAKGQRSVREAVLEARAADSDATHPSLMKAFRFVCDSARPGLDLPLPNGHARFEWVLSLSLISLDWVEHSLLCVPTNRCLTRVRTCQMRRH
jgi:3-(3-hydroxy-phenyl)propionate hydroxylase